MLVLEKDHRHRAWTEKEIREGKKRVIMLKTCCEIIMMDALETASERGGERS